MFQTIALSSDVLILSAIAFGHGMMCESRQRGASGSVRFGQMWVQQAVPPSSVIDYFAHCLNDGTVANVRRHLPREGWRIYNPAEDFSGTATRSGLCGDPVGVREHMVGGMYLAARYGRAPIVAGYTSGGYIYFQAEIDTNHNGYFGFFLCDLDSCESTDISGKCFR